MEAERPTLNVGSHISHLTALEQTEWLVCLARHEGPSTTVNPSSPSFFNLLLSGNFLIATRTVTDSGSSQSLQQRPRSPMMESLELWAAG